MMKSIQFKNIDEAATLLNFKDKGNRYECDCPECGQKSGYIFKETNFIKCNRENNCGVTTRLEFTENAREYIPKNIEVKEKVDYDNPIYQKELREFSEFMKIQSIELDKIAKQFPNAPDNQLRLIQNKRVELMQVFADQRKLPLHVLEGKFVFADFEFLKKEYPKLFENWDSYAFKNRNVLYFRINPKNQLISRIHLRSTRSINEKYKEIQLKLQDDKNDFFYKNMNANNIFITEGVIDALSIETVNKGVGWISIPGSTRTSNMLEFIKVNQDRFKNKNFVLALDYDNAGMKARKKIYEELDKLKIKYSDFDLNGYKDANDYLKGNLAKFKSTVDNSIQRVSIRSEKMNLHHSEYSTKVHFKNNDDRSIFEISKNAKVFQIVYDSDAEIFRLGKVDQSFLSEIPKSHNFEKIGFLRKVEFKEVLQFLSFNPEIKNDFADFIERNRVYFKSMFQMKDIESKKMAADIATVFTQEKKSMTDLELHDFIKEYISDVDMPLNIHDVYFDSERLINEKIGVLPAKNQINTKELTAKAIDYFNAKMKKIDEVPIEQQKQLFTSDRLEIVYHPNEVFNEFLNNQKLHNQYNIDYNQVYNNYKKAMKNKNTDLNNATWLKGSVIFKSENILNLTEDTKLSDIIKSAGELENLNRSYANNFESQLKLDSKIRTMFVDKETAIKFLNADIFKNDSMFVKGIYGYDEKKMLGMTGYAGNEIRKNSNEFNFSDYKINKTVIEEKLSRLDKLFMHVDYAAIVKNQDIFRKMYAESTNTQNTTSELMKTTAKEIDSQKLIDELKIKVESILHNDKLFNEYLQFASKFPDYSLNNQLLLHQQNPNMSFVASYGKFEEMGLHVQKGEKAHYIIVPQKYQTYLLPNGDEKTWNKLSAEEKKMKDQLEKIDRTSFAFKKCAFDISQTNIKEHPEKMPEIFRQTNIENNAKLFESIKQVFKEEGIRFRYDDLYSVRGQYNANNDEITLNSRHKDTGNEIKTAIHEYAHYILHRENNPGISREQAEIEAESSAKIVANHFGLDTSNSDVYIANYMRNNKTALTNQTILKRINGATQNIIKKINAHFQPSKSPTLQQPVQQQRNSKQKSDQQKNNSGRNQNQRNVGASMQYEY